MEGLGWAGTISMSELMSLHDKSLDHLHETVEEFTVLRVIGVQVFLLSVRDILG